MVINGEVVVGRKSTACLFADTDDVIQMRKFTQRRALLLALFFILVIALVAVYFFRENLYVMLNNLGKLGYLGVFLLSFVGAASVIIPVPYTVILLTISAPQFGFNHIMLAIVAGLGAAAGELVGYGLGYAGRRVVDKKHDRRFNAMLKIFNRFGIPAVFIFALTPLPDDLLFIPLGLMRYNLWKVFIPCVLGKFLMSLIITYVGAATGAVFAEGGMIIAAITAILLILAVIAMFKINWEKLVEKYLS